MQNQAKQASIWVLCEDCGHVSRVLSVMASRVLKERKSCPQCQSLNAPTLHYTAAGAHIHADDMLYSPSLVPSTQPETHEVPEWNGSRRVRSLFTHPFAWLRATLS